LISDPALNETSAALRNAAVVTGGSGSATIATPTANTVINNNINNNNNNISTGNSNPINTTNNNMNTTLLDETVLGNLSEIGRRNVDDSLMVPSQLESFAFSPVPSEQNDYQVT
jgi:hypothetical protein